MSKNQILPKRISREKKFSSSILDLNLDKIVLSSGKIINDYHVIEIKKESVCVIVLNKKKEICFIKSPRYITQSLEFELPAGGIENNEDIFSAGKREVLEETGYKVNGLKHIYTFYPANAISKQKAYVLTGKIISNKPVKKINPDEVYSVIWLSRNKAEKLIESNQITDGLSLVSLLIYLFKINK